MRKMELDVQKLFRELGLSGDYLGFRYLTYAILLTTEDESQLFFISKTLYINIASHYHTSVYCVERDIRTAIRIIWEKGNRELLMTISAGRIEKCPSNGAFIDIITAYLKNR